MAAAGRQAEGRAPSGALRCLTRRDFLARAGGALAGASALGLVVPAAWAAPRFAPADELDARPGR